VLISPHAAVGGIDREQVYAVAVGLGGEPVAEHRGRDAGDRLAEAFTAGSAAHGFPAHGAGVGEVEVLHRNGVDAVPQGVAEEPGDRVPDLGIPVRR
jgi:hypothetical protein